MQNNGKEMYKKMCCTCKVVFLFQLDLLLFFRRARCLRRLALAQYDVIFYLSKL